MSKNIKNIGLVSALTLTSRLLGLARESLTAGVFGTMAPISEFIAGLTLPNLFRRLLAEGGLTSALVPTLNDELEKRQRTGAFQLVNKVTSWLLLVTVTLTSLAMIVFSQDSIIRLVGSSFHANEETLGKWLLAARFTVVLFPYLVFVSLAAAFSAALQTLHRFLEPALSPIWLNLSIIGLMGASLWWARGEPAVQIKWLSAGWLLGGFLQMAVPAAALINQGWRPRLDFQPSEPLRAMLRLMAPTVFSSSIYLVNMSVSRLVGLSLNENAVAVLNFAQRLMELPIGVFAVAVSTVVFPLISRFAAGGDHANLAKSYRKGMRLILVINLPAAVGLGVLAMPIIRLVYQHGQFHSDATKMMTPVLIANVVGLPFLSFASLALRAFYSLKDTVTPVKAGMLSFIVNVGLSVILMRPFSTVGLAIASTVAVVVQACYLQWHLARKQEGLAFFHLISDVVKVFAASVLMGLTVGAGWWLWTQLVRNTKWYDSIGVTVMIIVGVVLYSGLMWIFKIEGREDVVALWAKIRARRA